MCGDVGIQAPGFVDLHKHVPTLCFICGLIGHSDNFCAKLFDGQGENIERPYGSWMRDDPKSRSYTMGNKWLRSNGATLMTSLGNKKCNMATSANLATVNTSQILGRWRS